MTCRISRLRGRPPNFAIGIIAWIMFHWLSVKSVGYSCLFTTTAYTTPCLTAVTFQTLS